jgi:hypothetical protein
VHVLFFLSAVARVAAAALALRIDEPSARGVRKLLAGLLASAPGRRIRHHRPGKPGRRRRRMAGEAGPQPAAVHRADR